MTCNHSGDPHKWLKYPDPLGVPIAYMESKDAFKVIGTSEHSLCHFNQVGISGEFPPFQELHKPWTNNHICCLLRKACLKVQPNLVITLPQDSVTMITLLCTLYNHASLQCLKMETDKEGGDRPSHQLSFCLFCQYSGSNDQSYLNHIMCGHYNVNYGCGKCLDAVFMSRQKLSNHMKKCEGLTSDGAKEKPSASQAVGMSSSAYKEKGHHKKKSQPDSQTSSQPNSQMSSQLSLCHSHHSFEKEPAATASHKKSHSGGTHKHFGEKHQDSKSSTKDEKKKHKKNHK